MRRAGVGFLPLKFPTGSQIRLTAAGRKSSVLLRHQVGAVFALDAQLGRLAQLQVESFRAIRIRRNTVAAHLPVASVLTC